jgi:hypothetical protein
MATDLYNSSKRWLVKRFAKNDKANAQVITIYVNGNPSPTDSGQKRRSHRGHITTLQGYP